MVLRVPPAKYEHFYHQTFRFPKFCATFFWCTFCVSLLCKELQKNTGWVDLNPEKPVVKLFSEKMRKSTVVLLFQYWACKTWTFTIFKWSLHLQWHQNCILQKWMVYSFSVSEIPSIELSRVKAYFLPACSSALFVTPTTQKTSSTVLKANAK